MFKKTLALLTVLSLILSMSACGSSAKPYDYDLSEYVTLGEYIGVEVEKVEPAAVTDEDVEQEIMIRLEENATTEEFDEGVIEDGVTANIDFEGRIDGETFEGGSATGHSLVIGSGSFIEGFESGLIGKSVGETVELNLTFPEDYNEEYGGKDVVFTVKINSFSKEIVPDLDEEFVKKVSDANTIDEYKALVKEELEVQAKEVAEQTMKADAWEQVYSNAVITKYPEAEIEAKKQEMDDYYQQYTKNYGMTMDDFLNMAGMTQEDYQNELQTYAETSVGEELIMYSIVRNESIEVTEEDYEKGAEEYALSLGFVDEDGNADVKALEEAYTKEVIETSLLWDKCFSFIYENAKIIEPVEEEIEEENE